MYMYIVTDILFSKKNITYMFSGYLKRGESDIFCYECGVRALCRTIKCFVSKHNTRGYDINVCPYKF